MTGHSGTEAGGEPGLQADAHNDVFEHLAEAIQCAGWALAPNFIDTHLLGALRADCRALSASGALHRAAVGRNANRRIRADLRGDEIFWLDAAQLNASRSACLARFEQLRVELNRRLQLGLFEFECHYARYAPGAGYRKHCDRFQDDATRILSSILYLNADWAGSDGGQLRLYLGDAASSTFDVAPIGGTLVLFLSEQFAHEVLPARRERLSLTGWFRARSSEQRP